MEVKDIIFQLRTKNNLSQDELAEKVYVTRQAVSRWENGDTVPNIETLKLLSKLFNVSINTLLGSPQQLVCQCCGMPLQDECISKEKDGLFNEEYCKWCYADGDFTMDFWKQYIRLGGKEKFDEFKQQIINEFNMLLNIEGLDRLNAVRLLDYLAGATRMIGGVMTKVGKTMIVVAPKNVDVSSVEAMVQSAE